MFTHPPFTLIDTNPLQSAPGDLIQMQHQASPPHIQSPPRRFLAPTILLLLLTTSLSATDRSTHDQPDDHHLPHQLHLLYVVPAGGTDRQLDTNGTIAQSAQHALDWLNTAGGRTLRLDTRNGHPDITFVQLDRTDQQIQSHSVPVSFIEWQLVARGHIQPNKLYAAYYQGHYPPCAAAPQPPLTPGQVAVLAIGDASCGAPLSAHSGLDHWEFTLIHEVFHLLGAVPSNTPHAIGSDGHLLDNHHKDLMSDGSWDLPPILDRGHDDYWNHNKPDYPDLSRSVFMAPTQRASAPPPGHWPVQRPRQHPTIPSPIPHPSTTTEAFFSLVNLSGSQIALHRVDHTTRQLVFAGNIDPDQAHDTGGWEGEIWAVTQPQSSRVLATWQSPAGISTAIFSQP